MNLQELIARQKAREAEEAPSLANIKTANVHQKLSDKKKKIQSDPSSPQRAFKNLHGSSGNTDLMDLGEASLYRSGGIVMDALKTMSNAATENTTFATDFDDSMESGWSNQRTADIKAGVSQEYRRQLQEDQHKVVQKAAEGEWMESLAAAADVSTRTLFDSAGVVPELAAGAALTAAGGVGGAAIFARRGQKLIEGGDKLFDTFQDARNLRKTTLAFRKPAREFGKSSALKKDVAEVKGWFDKAKSLGKAGVKGAAQTSIVNMEMTQQARNQIIEEYGEEAATPQRIAATALVNAVTLSVNPAIIKHLYLPKVPGAKAFQAEKGITRGSIAAANEIRKNFQTELKRMAATTDKGLVTNVANAVIDGAAKVMKAGGAEAVQEYAQTWGETLSVHTGQNSQPFWESLTTQLKDAGNINEATAAAFMGGFAGSQLRGATAVPVTAARVFTETAAKTGRKIADKTGAAEAVKHFAEIPEEQQQQLAEEALRNEAVFAEQKEQNEARITELEQAESLADITDETIIDDMMNLNKTGKYNLNLPEEFKAMKEGMAARYREQINILRTKNVLSAHQKVAKEKIKAGAKDVVKGAQKVAETVLTPELQQKALDLEVQARNFGDDAVEFVKNIKTEEIRAFSELAFDEAKTGTKEGIKALRSKAVKLSADTLRDVSELVGKNNPEVGQIISDMATKVEQREVKSGLRSKRITNFEQLSTATKVLADQGFKDEKSMASHGSRLMEEIKTRPGDAETVRALQKALTAYEQTDAFKNRQGEPGILSPANLKNARKKLKNFEVEYETPIQDAVTAAAGEAVDTVTDLAKALPKKLKEGAKFINEAATELIVGPKKERYKVKASKEAAQFLTALEANQAKIKKLGDDTDAVDQALVQLMDFFAADETVARYPQMFDTADPAVVVDVIRHYLPQVPADKMMTALTAKWDAPASQLTEKVTRKKAKVRDKDSIPLTPDGTIKLDETGVLAVDQLLTTKEKAALHALQSGINICQ